MTRGVTSTHRATTTNTVHAQDLNSGETREGTKTGERVTIDDAADPHLGKAIVAAIADIQGDLNLSFHLVMDKNRVAVDAGVNASMKKEHLVKLVIVGVGLWQAVPLVVAHFDIHHIVEVVTRFFG